MTQSTFSISASVLLPDGSLQPGTVYFTDGRIQRVAPGRDPGADLHSDGLLAPGLIDLQVNGAYGCDFTVDAASISTAAARLPETGVTAFLPTIITSAFAAYPERLRHVAQAMRRADGAQVLGAHLEGPYMNPQRKGAHPPAQIRTMDVAEMLAWADPAVTRIVTLAPELPGALDAVRALRAAGIVVSAGHSAATFEQAQVAFAAGVGWGTHLYNAMSPLQHREPGLMGALLTGSTPFGLIPDGIHSHPAMLRLAWLARGRDGIVLVTDCMAAMGMDPGTYALGEHTVTVALEGATGIATARLEDGTLAGSVLRMDEGLRCMTAFSGCSAADALMMASANPARLLGLEHKGRIAPGCDADLVLLSPDLRVTHTFVAGRLAFQAA